MHLPERDALFAALLLLEALVEGGLPLASASIAAGPLRRPQPPTTAWICACRTWPVAERLERQLAEDPPG
jgi:hypothetical protein